MSYQKTGRALSIKQPWAWCIVNGHKPVENRDWPTKLRGWIGIHAGKTFDAEGYDWIQDHFPEINMPPPDQFERGGIIGCARVVDCVEHHDSDWFFGRYGFVLKDARPLQFQACRGQLSFFKVNQ